MRLELAVVLSSPRLLWVVLQSAKLAKLAKLARLTALGLLSLFFCFSFGTIVLENTYYQNSHILCSFAFSFWEGIFFGLLTVIDLFQNLPENLGPDLLSHHQACPLC